MLTLSALGLTPGQFAELQEADATVVAAWLEAADGKPDLRSPAGWVIAGVRSGALPEAKFDASKARQVELYLRYLTHAGLGMPSEAEVIDDAFGPHGRLRHWVGDVELRERVLEHWRSLQGTAELIEREKLERAERWKRTNPGKWGSTRQPEAPPVATSDNIEW